jgi:hypothetical protein
VLTNIKINDIIIIENKKGMINMSESLMLKANILGGMNSYIIDEIGDDDIYDKWIQVVPDECSEDDLFDIAMDAELWIDAVNLFAELVKESYGR